MKLDEFLKLVEPEEFDLSAEFATKEYILASPSEKYIIYKTYTTDNDWSDLYSVGRSFRESIRNKYTEKTGRKISKWIDDPDSGSEILIEIYKRLWPFMYDEEKQRFWSDTLSSVQYTMSNVFEIYVESNEARIKRYNNYYKQKCTIRYMIDYLARLTDNDNLENKIESAAKELECVNNINLFLSAWHTLGNYCPVPRGFNVPRSNYGKHDFWDYTLSIIRKWYLEKNSILKYKILEENLFHYNKFANVEACEKWLSTFGDGEKGWEIFIDTFLFQDWVYERADEEHIYYDVKLLSPNHTVENSLIPINELDLFFYNYKERITNRARRIITKLSV